MALTKSTVKRPTQATGDQFIAFDDGSTKHAQGVAFVGGDGEHAGIAENPIIATPVVDPSESVTGGTAEDSRVVKTSTGRLWGIDVLSKSTSDLFLMIFDSATVPANTTAPKRRYLIPAGAQPSIQFAGIGGLKFATGISVAMSSTDGALTVTTAGEAFFQADYV